MWEGPAGLCAERAGQQQHQVAQECLTGVVALGHDGDVEDAPVGQRRHPRVVQDPDRVTSLMREGRVGGQASREVRADRLVREEAPHQGIVRRLQVGSERLVHDPFEEARDLLRGGRLLRIRRGSGEAEVAQDVSIFARSQMAAASSQAAL